MRPQRLEPITRREPPIVCVALARAVIHTIADRLTAQDGVPWTLTIISFRGDGALFRATLESDATGAFECSGATEGSAICSLAALLLRNAAHDADACKAGALVDRDAHDRRERERANWLQRMIADDARAWATECAAHLLDPSLGPCDIDPDERSLAFAVLQLAVSDDVVWSALQNARCVIELDRSVAAEENTRAAARKDGAPLPRAQRCACGRRVASPPWTFGIPNNGKNVKCCSERCRDAQFAEALRDAGKDEEARNIEARQAAARKDGAP